jgi:thymidine kinase
MFSGKTSALIGELEVEEIAQRQVVVIRSAKDTRDKILTTHSGKHLGSDTIREFVVRTLGAVDVANIDVIGIDEGWMFDDLLLAKDWADSGKRVIVSSIDGNFEQKTFPRIAEIVAWADKIKKKVAVCSVCKNHRAAFSKFVGAVPKNSEGVVPGGLETYIAICRACRIA